MAAIRKYSDMTKDEKRHSVELWKRFYKSLQDQDYEVSWQYWNKRMAYLNDIGVKTEKQTEHQDMFRYA